MKLSIGIIACNRTETLFSTLVSLLPFRELPIWICIDYDRSDGTSNDVLELDGKFKPVFLNFIF